MSTAAVPRASREEKDRLLEDFVRLCEIESPSRSERQCVDAVASELRGLGLQVEEDSTRSETGSDAGNLIARIPGAEGARTIMLCAHLDTVPLEGPVEVARENGLLTNKHEAILGADNKAAVAVILGVARRLGTDGSTARRRQTSAPSRAARPRTWWPSTARWSSRPEASTTTAPPRW